jgi:hypothetical protein
LTGGRKASKARGRRPAPETDAGRSACLAAPCSCGELCEVGARNLKAP